MVETRAGAWRHKLVVGLVFSTMVLAGLGLSPASADVSEVEGSAYGYFMDDVTLGQDPTSNVAGPEPIVTLPANGGTQTDSLEQGSAQAGPAALFESGPITVSTTGTTGVDGSVTSSASITDAGPGPFTADEVGSTCTASEADVTGSASFTNGVIVLQDPDPETSGEEGEDIVSLPANPAPNTSYSGTVANVDDNFTVVFNEQTETEDSITVTALHLILEGPFARGDLFIGQSVCGITADDDGGNTSTTGDDGGTTTTTDGNGGGSTTTSEPDGSTTTTEPDGSTTTTEPDGSTTTTSEPDGSTTTTQPDPGGDCEEPTDFVGQLIFQIFRGISDLLESLGISGFDDFGCDLDD